MKTVIYADILVIINTLVNYVLLRACAAFLKINFSPLRFFFAAASGGLFSLIILVEGIPESVSMIIKTAFLFLCVAIAFGAYSLKRYCRCFAAFLVLNLIFAGVMCALYMFVFPDSMVYSAGVVYFDISVFTLAVCSVICYVLISLVSGITASHVPKNRIYQLEITADGKTVKLESLFDTGNSLCDSFSGRPVIIADKSCISELVGRTDLTGMKNYRLIPYSTLKGGGLLEAFLAESVCFYDSAEIYRISDVYIAVADKKIFNHNYKALLGTPVFESAELCRRKENKSNDKKFARKT